MSEAPSSTVPEPVEHRLLDLIMGYEQGTLGTRDTLLLFAHLIETGMAWSLQGHYGRSAASLIEAGTISPEGVIDWDLVESVLNGQEG